MTAHTPTPRRSLATLRPDLAETLTGLRAKLRAELAAKFQAEMIQSDPRLAEIAAATHPGPVPVDARVMIPDGTIRRLARLWPEAQLGEIPEEVQIELCTILPDVMGELLARRYAMEGPQR